MNVTRLERAASCGQAASAKTSRKALRRVRRCFDPRRRFGTGIGSVWQLSTFGNRHLIKCLRTASRVNASMGSRSWLNS